MTLRKAELFATLDKGLKLHQFIFGLTMALQKYDKHAAAVASAGGGSESKHFQSLQIFTSHAEPGLDEFLTRKEQIDLEHKHRDEEDKLYRYGEKKIVGDQIGRQKGQRYGPEGSNVKGLSVTSMVEAINNSGHTE